MDLGKPLLAMVSLLPDVKEIEAAQGSENAGVRNISFLCVGRDLGRVTCWCRMERGARAAVSHVEGSRGVKFERLREVFVLLLALSPGGIFQWFHSRQKRSWEEKSKGGCSNGRAWERAGLFTLAWG